MAYQTACHVDVWGIGRGMDEGIVRSSYVESPSSCSALGARADPQPRLARDTVLASAVGSTKSTTH